MISINGISAIHVLITPNCRTKGDDVAIEEALQKIREEFKKVASYDANKKAKFHIVLTVERPLKLSHI